MARTAKTAPERAEPLPVARAAEIESVAERPRWLVDGLWTAEGVGVIGGAPKCCKTWLALDLAVSIASSTDALGRFPVVSPGPVLLYGAEDAASCLRERLEAIALARKLTLAAIDVRLILIPTLRLDLARDRARLRRTIEEHRPRMLMLDPLVRLHRIDENSAGEMSALLGELRTLQREYALALVLVHHLRKNGNGQGGQALRGSGDLHAWGDSNLYLRRRDQRLRLSIEHRSAPAPEACLLELVTEPAPHLRVADDGDVADPRAAADLGARIVELLKAAEVPLSRDALRAATRSRNATLGEALVRLRSEGIIDRSDAGFRLRPNRIIPIPVPATTNDGNGNGNDLTVSKQRPSA
jgi:hypothetical protein